MNVDVIRNEVLGMVTDLLRAYGEHNTKNYFAGFAADATFVFHDHPVPISGRATYETIWRDWESQGMRVLSCQSLDGAVQILDEDNAIFTHVVRTRVSFGSEMVLRERETIVLHRYSQGWLAVHDHLSAEPCEAE
jgi:ketosteroid isomerase-like protein